MLRILLAFANTADAPPFTTVHSLRVNIKHRTTTNAKDYDSFMLDPLDFWIMGCNVRYGIWYDVEVELGLNSLTVSIAIPQCRFM